MTSMREWFVIDLLQVVGSKNRKGKKKKKRKKIPVWSMITPTIAENKSGAQAPPAINIAPNYNFVIKIVFYLCFCAIFFTCEIKGHFHPLAKDAQRRHKKFITERLLDTQYYRLAKEIRRNPIKHKFFREIFWCCFFW